MAEILERIDEYDSDPTQFYTEITAPFVAEDGSNDSVTVRVPFIRQSERKAFKTCQYQWDWSWNQGFVPALPRQDARWFGTGLHLCLAEWYVQGKFRGKDMHETWEEFTGENYQKIATGPYFNPDEWVDAKALGHEMIDNYLAEHGYDPDWEIIATEQRYRMRIKDKNGKVVGVLVGTFDAVLREISTGKIWMIDHKTARERIVTNHLVKDEQAGTYVSVATIVLRAMGLIGKTEVVHGIIYNFLRKAKADTRPRNARGVYCNQPTVADYKEALLAARHPKTGETVFTASDFKGYKREDYAALAAKAGLTVLGEESKTQPAPLFKREYVVRNAFERARQLERVAEELAQMEAIRTGGLALTKSPGEHCGWCDFKELCEIDEAGGDVEDYARAAFRKRDPYADHRLGAANSKTSVAADTSAKNAVRKF